MTSWGFDQPTCSPWVGTEANEPLTSSEVVTILGQDTLAEVAEKTGADTGELADYVAEQLPVLIDQTSPDGQITSDPEVFSQAFTEFENNAPFTVPTARIGDGRDATRRVRHPAVHAGSRPGLEHTGAPEPSAPDGSGAPVCRVVRRSARTRDLGHPGLSSPGFCGDSVSWISGVM
ncbi:YidB family protein [Streptomyces sp. C11-1]|uniref:YidB family protein n=1 Tax=Streptomyces sp. C11-1 TaxID=3444503 RepID=UPI0037DA68F8